MMNVAFHVDARATGLHDVSMTDIARQEVPVITLGWRLRISLERAGLKAEDMAERLGVHRGTVSRWMHDETPPRPIYLREWAAICGVPFSWLSGEHANNEQVSGRDIHEFAYLEPQVA